MPQKLDQARPRSPLSDANRRGQSVVEFALVLPVMLLIVMMGIDFGRVFLGWINLNNTARIAANYAATNATLMAAGNPGAEAAYQSLVSKDLAATNCTPSPFPDPTFPDVPNPTDLGKRAHVEVTCQFAILTPIIGNILGGTIAVSASSDFPIRTGIIAGVPGAPPVVQALFNISPTGGEAPQTINFSDFSTGNLTSYAWDWEGDGIVDDTTMGNVSHPYTQPGSFDPTLTVSNGIDTDTYSVHLVITAPPGPVVNFTALPPSGPAPHHVTFTNNSTGSGTLTYEWNFGDGSPVSTVQTPPAKDYPLGTWTITLKVTDGFGQSNTGTATVTVTAAIPHCTVPDFKKGGTKTSDQIQIDWNVAGFNTTVIFNPARPPEYNIKTQSLPPGSSQPCSGTVLTVAK